jgi:hypothetical protein
MRFNVRLIVGAWIASFMFLSTPLALAQERLRPIGEVAFEPDPVEAQTGVIQLRPESRILSMLRIAADEGSADIREIVLVYRSGEAQRVRVRQRVSSGQRTSTIRIQEPRPLREIQIIYVPDGPVKLVLEGDARGAIEEPPSPQWVELGCKSVGFLVDRDILRLSTPESYEALRLRTAGYDIEMLDLGVAYSGGRLDRYRIGQVIPSGGRTNAIQLRETNRPIMQVELVYRTRALSTQKTRLCVDGLARADQEQ